MDSFQLGTEDGGILLNVKKQGQDCNLIPLCLCSPKTSAKSAHAQVTTTATKTDGSALSPHVGMEMCPPSK